MILTRDDAPSPRSSVLPALTGARFFAALAVVFFHYGRGALLATVPPLEPLAAAGPSAVSFFYVLSGAVMTWGCTRDDGMPSRSTRAFLSQRGARILPAYWLALALSVPPALSHVLKTHPGAGGVALFGVAVAAALLLVQAFIAPLSEGLNTPGWSISCEGFFYLVWTRLVIGLRSARAGLPWQRVVPLYAVGILVPLAGIAALHFQLVGSRLLQTLTESIPAGEMLARVLAYLPPLRLPEFAMGIVLGHALHNTPIRSASTVRATAIELLLIGFVVAGAAILGSGAIGGWTGIPLADRIACESGVLAPVYALLVWQLARQRGLFQRFLSTPSVQQLGEASYGLYILQEPVLVWFTAICKRVAPSLMLRWDSLLFWIYAALLIIISLAVHRVWEMPLRRRILALVAPPRDRG